ncbi:hypothetical protein ACSBR2_004687 [Camellia fascicularis]
MSSKTIVLFIDLFTTAKSHNAVCSNIFPWLPFLLCSLDLFLIVVALDISKDLFPIAKVSRALNVQLAKLDNQGNNTWQHSVTATEYDNGSHVTTEFQDGSYAIIRFTGH